MHPRPHPLEDDRLQTLRSYDILDTETEAEFDDVVKLASRICEVPISFVSLVDHDRQWFKATTGHDAIEMPRTQSICAHAIHQDGLTEINDTIEDVRTRDNPLLQGPKPVRFYAGVPLIATNGLPLGTLCVLDTEPRTLTDFQRDALSILAKQVMSQLELRRALKNQEILQKEMDHRVKNSLQTVRSLISLYKNQVSDSVSTAAFEAIERRLNAIIMLHREMHQSSTFEKVDSKAFLNGIIGLLAATCPPNVTLNADICSTMVTSNDATALAVIVNECVSNALKHAFPDGRAGIVTVNLSKTETGGLLLHCFDNGVGATVSADTANPVESLGRKIMEAAANQIGAVLEEESSVEGYKLTLLINTAPAPTEDHARLAS